MINFRSSAYCSAYILLSVDVLLLVYFALLAMAANTLTVISDKEELYNLLSSYEGKFTKINTTVDFGSEGVLINGCFT